MAKPAELHVLHFSEIADAWLKSIPGSQRAGKTVDLVDTTPPAAPGATAIVADVEQRARRRCLFPLQHPPEPPMNALLPALAAVVHVVDDHFLNRKHLRTVLAFHGYRAVTSEGAAAARVALLATPPDVVLLDLEMPGEHGYGLLTWMRTQPALAAVPVICVTASVPQSERERVRAAGFALFLARPITPQRLIAAVQQVLAASPAVHAQ